MCHEECDKTAVTWLLCQNGCDVTVILWLCKMADMTVTWSSCQNSCDTLVIFWLCQNGYDMAVTWWLCQNGCDMISVTVREYIYWNIITLDFWKTISIPWQKELKTHQVPLVLIIFIIKLRSQIISRVKLISHPVVFSFVLDFTDGKLQLFIMYNLMFLMGPLYSF